MITNTLVTFFLLTIMLLTTLAVSDTNQSPTVHVIEGEHKTTSLKPEEMSLIKPVTRSNKALVEVALNYGMLADAYQKSPQGMITEGYRFQLRQLYLNWLPKALEVPGQTIEQANTAIIRQWTDLLGQADYPDAEKEKWVQLLSNMLGYWSDKHQQQFYSLTPTSDVILELENKMSQCNEHLHKPRSYVLKQNACHTMGSITRQITSEDRSSETLNASMKSATYRFIESMSETVSLPWYKAYLDSKESFNDLIRDHLDTGYSYQQLAQILQLAGIDYPIVYQHIREFSLVHPQAYSH